jgi:cytochrome P450
MTATVFIPPAPRVLATEPSLLKQLWLIPQSTLGFWPEEAFELMVRQRTALGVTACVVNDPELARQILTVKAANYRRPSAVRRVAMALGGNGLFMAEGEDWRRQRRLLAPSFTPASIGVLLPHFRAAGLHLIRALDGKREANLSEDFQQTALEAVLRALFSLPDNAARETLARMVRDYIEGAGRPTLLDGIAQNDTAFGFLMRRRKRFATNWFAAIDAIVAARKENPPQAHQRDMLDLLLALRDGATGEALSHEEIRDQCGTMLFAGSETTARLMFWAAYVLTQDTAEQTRLREEIAAFPPERIATLDDLQNWPRLRNVLLETLRLYPPLPHIFREAIGPDDIGGEKIAPKTMVWISPWLIHRHKKFWEQPTVFLPDRFEGKQSPWTQIPAYIPFGAGPRICIGAAFAMAEAQIVLATLLHRFTLALKPGPAVLPIGRTTTEPSYEPTFAFNSQQGEENSGAPSR